MEVLKNGVANKITIVVRDDTGTLLNGKTVRFCVVAKNYKFPSAEAIPDDQKIGAMNYDATARPSVSGTYDGTLPFTASLSLDTAKEYRVVPIIAGEFRGGDPDENVFRVEYA